MEEEGRLRSTAPPVNPRPPRPLSTKPKTENPKSPALRSYLDRQFQIIRQNMEFTAHGYPLAP